MCFYGRVCSLTIKGNTPRPVTTFEYQDRVFLNLPIYVRRPVLHNEEQLPWPGTYVVVRRLMFAGGHFFENFFYFDTYFISIHVDLYCLNPRWPYSGIASQPWIARQNIHLTSYHKVFHSFPVKCWFCRVSQLNARCYLQISEFLFYLKKDLIIAVGEGMHHNDFK